MDSKRHFEKPFKLFHLSEENLDGKTLEPRPLDKMRVMEGEDWKVPRICVSTSSDGAVSSLVDSMSCSSGIRMWVHVPLDLDGLFKANKVHRPSLKQVPDAEVTGEHWLKAPATFKTIGQIEIDGIDDSYDIRYQWKGREEKIDRFKWHWTVMKV